MKTIVEIFTQEKYLRKVGIVLVGTLIHAMTCDNFSDGKQFFFNLFYTFLFWEGAVAITFYLRRKFPLYNQTITRIALTLLLALVYIFSVDFISHILFYSLGLETELTFKAIFDYFQVNIIATLIVGGFYESIYFFSLWKIAVTEKEQLENQQLRSQLDVLKTQISPHFLFNSFNTLVTLISEDQNLAVQFTRQLSDVYRYILKNQDRELVSLATELEFTESYVFLLKMRFGENLQFHADVPDLYLEQAVAPLTLQMLVENAVKHNITSTAKPLHIEILIEDGETLVVKNNLQKRSAIRHSTKKGLENIRQRYQILSDRNIEIEETQKEFRVALPLVGVAHFKQELVSA